MRPILFGAIAEKVGRRWHRYPIIFAILLCRRTRRRRRIGSCRRGRPLKGEASAGRGTIGGRLIDEWKTSFGCTAAIIRLFESHGGTDRGCDADVGVGALVTSEERPETLQARGRILSRPRSCHGCRRKICLVNGRLVRLRYEGFVGFLSSYVGDQRLRRRCSDLASSNSSRTGRSGSSTTMCWWGCANWRGCYNRSWSDCGHMHGHRLRCNWRRRREGIKRQLRLNKDSC